MQLVVIIVLALIVLVIVLPVVAYIFATKARQKGEALENEVIQLRRRLDQLESEWLQGNVHQRTKSVPATQVPQPVQTPSTTTIESLLTRQTKVTAPSLPPVLPPIAPQPLVPEPALAAAPPVIAPPPIHSEPVITPPPQIPVPEAQPPRLPAMTPPPVPAAPFDWERFLGVKMFAWVGGLAFFLGVGFALKYSFDHGLISPLMRVIMGAILGLGLLVGGMRLERPKYAVTVQALCATGVLVLYADIFAANSFYHLLPMGAAFGLMSLVTVAAFVLAVHLEAQAVAVLGLVGGFLTPPLLSTGQDNPLGLFGYIALLDAGLAAITARKRWNYLLALGAAGTFIMQWGWVGRFFEADKTYTALAIFLGFAWFFTAAGAWISRSANSCKWIWSATLALPASAFAFAFNLLHARPWGLGERPGLLFGFAFLIDAGLLALVWKNPELRAVQVAAGSAIFGLATLWTSQYLNQELLWWALGIYFAFGVVHTVYPLLWDRRNPGTTTGRWSEVFSLMTMGLLLIPLFRLADVPLSIWPAFLAANLLAMAIAYFTLSLVGVMFAMIMTMFGFGLWFFKMPMVEAANNSWLGMIAGFAVFLFAASLYLGKKLASQAEGNSQPNSWIDQQAGMDKQLPTLSAAMPFVLLAMAAIQLNFDNLSPLFGVAALLLGLLLGLAYYGGSQGLVLLALGGVCLVEFATHAKYIDPASAALRLSWHGGFWAVFWAAPFAFMRRQPASNPAFVASALAGPIHLLLVWHVVEIGFPGFRLSLLPLIFAAPYLISTALLWRTEDKPERLTRLAWQAGMALFFITLFVPVEYKRQWLTIGWALEGVALLWLFHHVPHRGLTWVGIGLLTVSFARLALNFEILRYYPREGTAPWNWFLYAYGIVIACLFLGAYLLAPPRNRVGEVNVPPWLRAMGTLLAFWLLNIEIASHYSTGQYITFNFSGSFERDMAYSLAWALFAFVLLVIGIRGQTAAARYAGLALLSVTLLKLFFHDLWSLGGLYRIGSLIGLAVVSIPVSYLYQRFMSSTTPPSAPPQP